MIPPFWISKFFGCPYHGLVRNGVLTLPNAETIAYDQPGTHNGNSYRIAIPGLPAISRTSEEAADDAAQGFQWKTTAIPYGALWLHGRSIGSSSGWVYIDSLGMPWVVLFRTAPAASGNAATLQLRARRLFSFGPFTVTQKDFDQAVSDCGLDSAHATGAGNITIDDVDTNGSRVLLKVAGVINNATSGTNARGYAFLLLELSDDGADDIEFTAAVTIEKAQSECMPTVTGDDTLNTSATDAAGPAVNTTGGTDACGPYEEYAATTVTGAFSWETGTITDQNVTSDYAFSSIGHVIGGMFTAAGVIKWISIDLEIGGDLALTWSNTSSGSASAHGAGCGGTTGQIDQSRRSDEVMTEYFRQTLHVGGDSHAMEWTIDATSYGEHFRTLTPFYGPGLTSSGLFGAAGGTDLDETITGLGTFTDSQSSPTPGAKLSFPIRAAFNWFQAINNRGLILENYGAVGAAPSVMLTIRALRMTNKVAGLDWRVTVGLWSTPTYALGSVTGHVFAADASDANVIRWEDEGGVIDGYGINATFDPFEFDLIRNDPDRVNYV